MAFYKDFSFVDKDFVITYKGESNKQVTSLPPGQGFILQFPAMDGEITLVLESLDPRKPVETKVIDRDSEGPVPRKKDPQREPGDPPEPLETKKGYNHVSVLAELIPPGTSQPVEHLKTKSGLAPNRSYSLMYTVTGVKNPSQWQVRVTNKDTQNAKVKVKVSSNIGKEFLRTEFIAHQLLDHTYIVLLEALAPSATIHGHTMTVGFNPELHSYLPEEEASLLGPHEIPLPDNIEVKGEAHLENFSVAAGSGQLILGAIHEKYERLKQLIMEPGPTDYSWIPDEWNIPKDDLQAPLDEGRKRLLQHIDMMREFWEKQVILDQAVIRFSLAFTDINLVVSKHILGDVVGSEGPNVNIDGIIQNITVNVYVAFDYQLESCRVFTFTPAQFKPNDIEGKVADFFGFIPRVNSILGSKLAPIIQDAAPLIGRYLGEALARLARQEAVFHGLLSDENNWHVRHTAIPGKAPDGSTRLPDGSQIPDTWTDTDGNVTGGGSAGRVSGENVTATVPDPSLGVLPPKDEFIVVKPETLPRLDKIETLVFVMMENRSYDHMLGYLRKARGPQYEGLRGNESNTVKGRTGPVLMRPINLDFIPLPYPITQIPYSPNHEFEPVEKQIANGAMSGFAQDFEDDGNPGKAEAVMSYYTAKEVPVYDQLATDYMVCNHWYCAHAGATFPNRFVELTGMAPELRNHEVDDPNLGFLGLKTIFDVLNDYGIEWTVFESDFSIMRLFNRFRLNTKQVVPFKNHRDSSKGFIERAKAGDLPPVVFVEPNFADIPPISTANDDHAPADIARGQNFIAEVVEALKANKEKWSRTLLAITYDEHGGFYDHVSPPGTLLGKPEFIGTIPRVHPEGQDFMGPRVPAFIISPFVSPGSVCNDILDHTSIIKTILLRHRARIPTHVFKEFGPRVNMIAHLGVALDLDDSRIEPASQIKRMSIKKRTVGAGTKPVTVIPKPGNFDFHEALRRVPLPKRQ